MFSEFVFTPLALHLNEEFLEDYIDLESDESVQLINKVEGKVMVTSVYRSQASFVDDILP